MPLSPRQQEILRLLAQGRSNKEIGFELGITEGTVKQHLFALYKKLGVTNRAKAVLAASELQHAPVTPPPAAAPIPPHYRWRMVTSVIIRPKPPSSGSTAWHTRFDQEMRALQHEAQTLSEALDGLLAVMPGNGLLVSFGLPSTHLDDPARALFLAQRLHAWLDANDFLQAGIGIATAAEVVADQSTVPYRGESIDMALSLAIGAAPGQVLVSEITCRLAGPVARYSAPRALPKLTIGHRELLTREAVDVHALAARTPLPFIDEMLATARQQQAIWVAVEGWPPQSSVRLQDAIAIALQAHGVPTYRLRLPTDASVEHTARCALGQLQLLTQTHNSSEPTPTQGTPQTRLLSAIDRLARRGPLALVLHGINTHGVLQQVLTPEGARLLENSPVMLITSVLSDGQDTHIAARLLPRRPDAAVAVKTYRLNLATKPSSGLRDLHADLAALIDTLSPAGRELIRRIAASGAIALHEAGQQAREIMTTGLFSLQGERIACRDASVRESLAALHVQL